ncbi:MAG TPA: threonine synthase [Acidimicrobiales bacterium]|nr:threonine synthase [Acidimicrobiales bacterium]
MRYLSTRGDAPVLEFGDALLTGLAVDGGLYVPERWPSLPRPLSVYRDLPYVDVATDVIWPFVEGTGPGAMTHDELGAVVEAAYTGFRHREVVPLHRLDGGSSTAAEEYVLELHWGPTLAFKDIALQLVGHLFEHELQRRSTTVTIVGATSGDTGSAAIEAVRGREGIQLVMLHPAGRVSDVQRRQMTTVTEANIHNVAVAGTFDDCQDLVKAMFGDRPFRERMRLAAVNSINWARVAAQIVYYVTTAARLEADRRPVSFTVPTGNFGNVLAGHVARRMGTPIERLVLASNRNDIVTRTHRSGVMENRGVEPTTSPAMDIQVSSNFERLLHDYWPGEPAVRGAPVAEAMTEFRATGRLVLPPSVAAAFTAEFDAGAAAEDEVAATIAEVWENDRYLIDPHTAVGVTVGRRLALPGEVMVEMATAHPAKFGDTVARATGVQPELPDHLADLMEREEHFVELPDDLTAIENYVVRTCGG